MERVVITGMGVISPLGNTVDQFWSRLAAGESGITPIDSFDTTHFKNQDCRLGASLRPECQIRPQGGPADGPVQPVRACCRRGKPGRTPVSGWRSWTGNGWASM
ncbi:beta-ketoacyl synthase N-terminal-like domain-containing protein [Paenibacillus rhizoplanae]